MRASIWDFKCDRQIQHRQKHETLTLDYLDSCRLYASFDKSWKEFQSTDQPATPVVPTFSPNLVGQTWQAPPETRKRTVLTIREKVGLFEKELSYIFVQVEIIHFKERNPQYTNSQIAQYFSNQFEKRVTKNVVQGEF